MVRLRFLITKLTARPWFDVGRLLDAVVSGDHVEIILVLGEDDAHGAHGDAGGELVVRVVSWGWACGAVARDEGATGSRSTAGTVNRGRGGSMGGRSTPPPITSTPSAVVDGDRRATEAALLVVLMLVMVTGAVCSTSGGWWWCIFRRLLHTTAGTPAPCAGRCRGGGRLRRASCEAV